MPDFWADVDATLAEVPINIFPLVDEADPDTIKDALVYNAAGMDLVWNFFTTAGAFTQTAVTPTTGGGDYDWTNQGNGIYTLGMPASGGASINNNLEGVGWFTGQITDVKHWRGPTIGFRDSDINNILIDDAFTTIPADVQEISGDSTAADNLEKVMDDTGFDMSNSSIGSVDTVGSITTIILANATGQSPAVGSTITMQEGVKNTLTWENLGDISTRAEVIFSVKTLAADNDDQALIRVTENDNLDRLNAAALPQSPIVSTDATLTVTSPSDATVTVVFNSRAAAALIAAEGLQCDLKVVKTANVDSAVLYRSTLDIVDVVSKEY